jgi:hypothetical protein
MAKMRPPIIPEQPVPVLSDDQVRGLLAVCSGKDFRDRGDTAIICLFLDTACGSRAWVAEVQRRGCRFVRRGPALASRARYRQGTPRDGPPHRHQGRATLTGTSAPALLTRTRPTSWLWLGKNVDLCRAASTR